jgi:uncharacterized radical SAM superfamily protein
MNSTLCLGSQAEVVRQAEAGESLQWIEAWRVRANHHPSTIRFDRPLRTLPVSVTGQACALRCAHCGGHYLRHMHSIWDVRANGADRNMSSLLISGGCDPQGRVPVAEHLGLIAQLKEGRRLNWHVGMIDEETVRAIAPLVDVVSFDVVGDAETAREVYGLDLTLDDYMRTYDVIWRHVPIVPHLTVGLRGGRISGEYAAIEALAARNVAALILIILIPTEGTAYAQCSPPSPEEVAAVMIEARLRLPAATLMLGCMRPHGAYRQAVDVLAVRAGLNGIVNPSGRAEREAVWRGLRIVWGEECCALP